MKLIMVFKYKFVPRDYDNMSVCERLESGEVFEEMARRSLFPNWPREISFDADLRPVLVKERVQ